MMGLDDIVRIDHYTRNIQNIKYVMVIKGGWWFCYYDNGFILYDKIYIDHKKDFEKLLDDIEIEYSLDESNMESFIGYRTNKDNIEKLDLFFRLLFDNRNISFG